MDSKPTHQNDTNDKIQTSLLNPDAYENDGVLHLLQLWNSAFFSHRVLFSTTTNLSLQGQGYRCDSFPSQD